MRSIFGWVRCDSKDCRNAFFGTNEEARDHGWFAHGSHGLSTTSVTVHFCPEHYDTRAVQNSGHTEKENTMPSNPNVVTAKNTLDFIAIRDALTAIMSNIVYYKDSPVSDLEGFDDAEWARAAEEIMAKFDMTLIKPDEQPF